MTAVSHATDAALAPLGLTCAQAEVLGVLWAEDGLSQRVLQSRLGISGATVTRLVDLLEAHGFVRRRVGAGDARVRTLHLTAAGNRLRDGVLETKRDFDARLLAGFENAQRRTLLAGLGRLVDNVAPVSGPQPQPSTTPHPTEHRK